MMRGREEGSEESTTPSLNLLYAETTNDAKQKNKQEQTRSHERSGIPLLHDKGKQ